MMIVSLLSACSASAKRTLDSHVFDIPKPHIIPDGDAPFFLPALDARDGFSFYLNPEASLPDRNLIAVASKDRICARAAGTAALVNATICAPHPPAWQDRPLHKVSDGVFWTYDLPAELGQRSAASLASCSAMAEGSQPGRCMANLPYGNLVLTIYFRDDQLAALPGLYDRSVANLKSWER